MPEPARTSATTQGPALVTGAAGFIGSHLSAALLRSGRSVIGLDNLDDFYDPALKRANLNAVEAAQDLRDARFEFVHADIRDANAVTALYASRSPSATFHLAARAGVRPSIAQPALYASVNLEGTTTLLEAARLHAQAAPFVLASSSSVYGNNAKVPFSEDDPVDAPISPYAATKRACELIARTYHELYRLPVACIRFFTVFGPRQRPDLAIAKFIRLIAEGRPVPIFGDGSMARDYTHIDDIVAGVLAAEAAILRHGYRIWNLGSDRPVRLDHLVDAIARVVGRPAIIDRRPVPPGDVDRTCADLTRARAELGYHPHADFEPGLRSQADASLRAEAPAPRSGRQASPPTDRPAHASSSRA